MYRVYAHDVRNLLQTAGNFFTDSQQLVFISKYFQVIIMTFSLKCSLKTCTEKTCTVQSINVLYIFLNFSSYFIRDVFDNFLQNEYMMMMMMMMMIMMMSL